MERILIADDSRGQTAHYYMRLGLARAFAAGGHEVLLWDIHSKSAIDMFDEFKPTVLSSQTYNIDRGLIRALQDNPQCKVFMKAADWSPFSESIDLKKYPVLVATEQEIKNVETLRKLTGKPDFLDIHYHRNRIKQTHSHWTDKLGITVNSLMPATDIMDYVGGERLPEYESDICFVGGKWGYKSKCIDSWLLPLCDISLGLNVKIFGNKHWGIPQYCGTIDNNDVKHAFASAKVCPNVSEPHAQDFGYELNERVFKLLSNKCPVVSDYTESLAIDLFPTEVEYAKSPTEFKEKVLAVINGDLQIDTEAGYQKVMSEHTYIHRAIDIFNYLDMTDEANVLKSAYADIRKNNDL